MTVRTVVKILTKGEQELKLLAQYSLGSSLQPPLVGDEITLPTKQGEEVKKSVFTVIKRRFPIPPPNGDAMAPEIWLLVE
jgi:hypothetical protein